MVFMPPTIYLRNVIKPRPFKIQINKCVILDYKLLSCTLTKRNQLKTICLKTLVIRYVVLIITAF